MLRLPVLIINFKTYRSAVGKEAYALAKICQEVADETNIEIAVAAAVPDIKEIASQLSIPVLAQHVDPLGYGSHTGSVVPEHIKELGAVGTLINHSEKRIPRQDIQRTIEKCHECGLMTIVCAQDEDESEDLSLLAPAAIAYEPPELIGGDISVSASKPDVIEEAVRRINHHAKCGIIIVGAGIKTAEDVRRSIELGAKGVLLASGVTNAADPKEAIRNLVSGLR